MNGHIIRGLGMSTITTKPNPERLVRLLGRIHDSYFIGDAELAKLLPSCHNAV